VKGLSLLAIAGGRKTRTLINPSIRKSPASKGKKKGVFLPCGEGGGRGKKPARELREKER